MTGHGGTIRALAYSPDGATLATAGEDGEVKLWDTAGGRERVTLTGHSDMVNALAFSPAGRTLATASLDATVKLWDVFTHRERATLQGHSDGVSSLAFAPRGRQLATGSYDGSVRLWEPAAPVFVPTACFEGPAAVESIAFERGRPRPSGAGPADVLARWDVRTGAVLARPRSEPPRYSRRLPRRPVDATAQPRRRSPRAGDGHGLETASSFAPRVAARSLSLPKAGSWPRGTSDGDVLLWDARTGRQLAVLKGHRPTGQGHCLRSGQPVAGDA